MFRVINKRTGKEPDLCQLARRCKWAKHLVYCDMEGFAVEEDGTLILLDECGNVAYPPNGMFEIIWDAPVVHGHWVKVTNGRGGHECSICHVYAPSFRDGTENKSSYCPMCGAIMDEVTE